MTTYLATIRIEAFGLAEAKEEAAWIADHCRNADPAVVVSVVQEPSRGTYRSPKDIPKQPCPYCGEMRQPEAIHVPTVWDENQWVAGRFDCECLNLLGSDKDGPVALPHGVSVCSPAVTEAIEAAKREMYESIGVLQAALVSGRANTVEVLDAAKAELRQEMKTQMHALRRFVTDVLDPGPRR